MCFRFEITLVATNSIFFSLQKDVKFIRHRSYWFYSILIKMHHRVSIMSLLLPIKKEHSILTKNLHDR